MTHLKTANIAFKSPKDLIHKFDELEQSNLFLIKKNQENQEKCLAIANKLKKKHAKKREQLEILKAKKTHLTQGINSKIDKATQKSSRNY